MKATRPQPSFVDRTCAIAFGILVAGCAEKLDICAALPVRPVLEIEAATGTDGTASPQIFGRVEGTYAFEARAFPLLRPVPGADSLYVAWGGVRISEPEVC